LRWDKPSSLVDCASLRNKSKFSQPNSTHSLFHLDEAAAQNTFFKGLAASGWHGSSYHAASGRRRVPVGGSIVWINKAFTNHTATSEDDGKTFDTGEIKPGESSRPVKFDKEGEFNYHCTIHGKTMGGKVLVKPATAN
jgi:plastocyanin